MPTDHVTWVAYDHARALMRRVGAIMLSVAVVLACVGFHLGYHVSGFRGALMGAALLPLSVYVLLALVQLPFTLSAWPRIQAYMAMRRWEREQERRAARQGISNG